MRPLIVIRRIRNSTSCAGTSRRSCFPGCSAVLTARAGLMARGLNFGIDFRGGILIEARTTTGPADLAEMRNQLNALGLGEVALQEFGAPTDVLIRFGAAAGRRAAQMQAIAGGQRRRWATGVEYRRIEVVGPRSARADPRRHHRDRARDGRDRGLCLVPLRMAVRHRRDGRDFHDVTTTVGLFALTPDSRLPTVPDGRVSSTGSITRLL